MEMPGDSSGHILPYRGVMTGNNSSSVPVVQTLSKKHDVCAITCWLTEWIHAGAPVPRLKSMNFQVVLGNQHANLPQCFSSVDAADCIKMICQ